MEQSVIHPTLLLHLKTHLKARGRQMLFSLIWHQCNCTGIQNILMQRLSQNSCRTLEGLPKAASAGRLCQGQLWGCTDVSQQMGDGMGSMKFPGWASLWQLRQESCSLEHVSASARVQLLSLLLLWKAKAAKVAQPRKTHCSDLTSAWVRHTKFITVPKVPALKYNMMSLKNEKCT